MRKWIIGIGFDANRKLPGCLSAHSDGKSLMEFLMRTPSKAISWIFQQIFIDSHTWIYIRKRNDYAQVEEQQYLAQQQQQQQQMQNHQNMAHRTLPRQQNG